MATKTTLLLILAFTTFCAFGQDKIPDGYILAPTLSITGDFNGDGNPDTLTQFIADSTGHPVKYMEDIASETWDDYVYNFGSKGYYTAIALTGSTDSLNFKYAQGVYLLINLGNINKTKGDEIAVIPDLVDQSRHSYCHIYSLCNGTWQQVFEFNVHEDAFDYTADTMPVFTTLPGILEKRKGKWYFYDYLEMDYDNPKDVGNMMPLKVDGCK